MTTILTRHTRTLINVWKEIIFNPRLPEAFLTRPPKGWLPPLLDSPYKASDSYDLGTRG